MDPTASLLHLPLLQHPFLASLSQAFAGNVYISGLVMILLNVGTSFLMQDMMPLAQRVFANVWVRRLVFFAIFFTATRDLVASVLLTVAFTLLVDMFLNERSAYYLLPDEYRTPAASGAVGGSGAVGAGESTTVDAAAQQDEARATARETFANPGGPAAHVQQQQQHGGGFAAFQQRAAQWDRLRRYGA
jgi:hypothetical protein